MNHVPAPARAKTMGAMVLMSVCLLAGLLSSVSPAAANSPTGSPTAPTGLTATWTDARNVGLEWTASSDDDGVLGYKVFRDGVEIGRNPNAQTAPFLVTADMAHCDNNNRIQGMARVANILETNPGRIFISGDVSQTDGSVNAYDCFDSVYGASKARMWAVPGNHDYQSGGQPFFDYFGPQAGHTQLGRFSQKWGPWHIVGINTSCWELADSCGVGSVQYEWLKSELESSTSACTAIIAHHPRWSTRNPGNAVYLAPMYDLAFRHGVELWFSGDDHFYERYPKLGPDGQTHDRGIRQVITGVGGFETRGYGPYIAEGPHAKVRHNRSLGAVSITGRPSGYDLEFLAEVGSTFTDSTDEPCHGANSGVVPFRDRNRITGATHTYRVAAYDADGNVSQLSAPVIVTVGSPTGMASPGTPTNAAPIGELEQARIEADGTLVATGWALDPDVTASTKVRLYVDGVWIKQGPAIANRPDIGAAYPSHGSARGLYLRVPLDHQVHEVCARALDHTGVISTLLGCVMTDRLPVGEFESAVADPTSGDIIVRGWALDLDLGPDSPTRVHMYLNSQRVRAPLANLNKPYVGISYPRYGNAHGFWQRIPTPSPGWNQVCIWAINNVGVPSTNLGCRTVNV